MTHLPEASCLFHLKEGGRCQGPNVVLFMQALAKGAQDRTFRSVISLDLLLAVHAVACAILLIAIIT